jgi:N-acetylmuramoyl-L-alanine amidase
MRLAAILVLFAVLLGAAPSRALEAGAATAKRVVAMDARLAGDDKRTRLIVDLNGKVDLAAFTLADPYRVVVDLPELSFDLPAGAGRNGRGLISAFRYGLFAPGKARIVLDAKGPVAVDRAFLVEQHDSQPARLVVDLVPTDRESFIRSAAVKKRSEPGKVVSVPLKSVDDIGPPVIVISPKSSNVPVASAWC